MKFVYPKCEHREKVGLVADFAMQSVVPDITFFESIQASMDIQTQKEHPDSRQDIKLA